jgi:pimeloyl-ACP methyl ester carboxylesterase
MERFERDGLVFDVVDRGPADGPVVVLLHGFPENASSWDQVAPALNEAGYRTLAPNQRGYSPGARPKGRRAYTLPMLSADVVALLDDAGAARAHVVGHDWGGGVAWALAARHAERVTTLTSVSTPHPAALLRSLGTSSQLLHSWYMLALQTPWLPERLMLGRPGGPLDMVTQLVRSGLPENLARQYRDFLSGPGALTAAINWYRAMPLVSPRRLSVPVTVPSLYVWSTEDQFLGRKPAELTERYVHAAYRFEVFEGTSHWIPETEPERLASILLEHFKAHS